MAAERAFTLSLAAGLWLAACGGSVVVPSGADGAAGAETTSTGTSTCPASAPAEGAPCRGSVTCSYGTDDCQQPFQCVGDHWSGGPLTCVTCPASVPILGEPCGAPGHTCHYSSLACAEVTADATCTSAGWDVTTTGVECEAACPAAPPENGAPCDGCCNTVCDYPSAPGCTPITATCDGNTWSIPIGTCTLPAPCATYDDPVSCQSDVGCRWLQPGCQEPAVPFAGCFTNFECQDNDECPPGEACWKAEYDPCFNQGCAACSATTFLCLPPPPP